MYAMLTTTLCNRCQAELTIEDQPPFPITNEQLRDMYIPSDIEISQIRLLIDAADHDIDRYDAEISRLSNVLATLKHRRGELCNYRDRCYSSLSPIRNLPMEIMVEIFFWCCRPGLLAKGTAVVAPAITLSQTCSYWRKIALDTPGLWSNLELDFYLDQLDDTITFLLDRYLRRSKSAPLTMRIFTGLGDIDELGKDSSVWSILQAVFDHGDRWKDVSFYFEWSVLSAADAFLHQLPNRHYSDLKYLAIESDKGIPLTQSSIFSSIWQRAPILESLDVTEIDDDGSLSTTQCLQKLTIDRVVWKESFFRLLKNFPTLREISFSVGSDMLTEHPLSPPLVHSGIRSFKFSYSSLERGSSIMTSLTLPSLTNLELSSHTQTGRAIFPSLKGMIERSGCYIQHLTLYGGIFQSHKELLEILTLTPSVTELSLEVDRHHFVLAGDLFSRLAFNFDGSHSESTALNLLPVLTSFRLSFDQSTRPPLWYRHDGSSLKSTFPDLPHPEDILLMVSSRRWQAPNSSPKTELRKLARFELSASHKPKPGKPTMGKQWAELYFRDVEPRLLALEGEGLELSLNVSRD